MSFDSLGLSDPILKAVTEQEYETPSPIQQKAIPSVIQGRDVMAAAQTGTGKTAGFTLPLLERLITGTRPKTRQARALILTPTRELAAQINASVKAYGTHVSLRSLVVFGGVKIGPQKTRLQHGVDILVATPGRLLDLYQQGSVKFDQLEILVLDEADRMLDMGFIHDIRKILAVLPKQRQTLMFSATFSNDIRKLAKTLVKNPVEISVSPRNTTVDTVKQWICPVDKKRKTALLIQLIQDEQWDQALVFSRTKHGANRIAKQLEAAGIKAAAIHGNKSQGARTRALASFKQNDIQILVATDIAARGIDIHQLPQVVNFDLPNVPEDYVHRIGRTGRAGQKGQAISLVSADEVKQLSDIEHLIKQVLKRTLIDGFEPSHDLPITSLGSRIKAPKKPKSQQNKQGTKNNNSRRRHRNKNAENKQAKRNNNNTKNRNQNNRKKKPKNKTNNR